MLESKDLMHKEYFEKILNKGKKKTSYKYYCTKALFKFIENDKDVIDTYKLGCMMIAVAYFDMDKYFYNVSSCDRLITSKVFLLDILNYSGNDTVNMIYEDLISCNNKEVIGFIKTLVQYVPYLLLSYGQWDEELEGLVTTCKNRKISELSIIESHKNFYSIVDDIISINLEFYIDIKNNLYKYNEYVDNLIEEYFGQR